MSGIHAGLTVGLPLCGRPTSPWWAVALATMDWPMGIDVNYCVVEGMEVGNARNAIAEQCLETNSKYLWFIDDDTAPPRHAAKRLIAELQKDDDLAVCGGIYCTKSETPEPIVQKELRDGVFWNWNVGDVFPCEGLATGCMMIRVDAFRKVEKPWFRTIDTLDTRDMSGLKATDDLFFCGKLKEAGLKVKAHGGVLPFHWDVTNGKSYGIPNGHHGKPEPRILGISEAMNGAKVI